MHIQRNNYQELGLPVGPYTHAVIHNNVLYTSGLTAFGSHAQQGSISEQAKEIFTQLAFICSQQNTVIANIIKVTIFVCELNDMQELRETLFNIYHVNIPASSLIQVNALFMEDLKIEIEAIVAVF